MLLELLVCACCVVLCRVLVPVKAKTIHIIFISYPFNTCQIVTRTHLGASKSLLFLNSFRPTVFPLTPHPSDGGFVHCSRHMHSQLYLHRQRRKNGKYNNFIIMITFHSFFTVFLLTLGFKVPPWRWKQNPFFFRVTQLFCSFQSYCLSFVRGL